MGLGTAALIGSIAAPVIGGALSFFGQRESNRTNRQIARDATNTNIQEAQRNRDWQEQMSNTAYSRAMVDMKQAGLNPILAYNQGGASTPGGAQGQAVSTEVGNEMEGALSTAKQLQFVKQQLTGLQYDNKNKKRDLEKKNQEERTLRAAEEQHRNSARSMKMDENIKRLRYDILRKNPNLMFLKELSPALRDLILGAGGALGAGTGIRNLMKRPKGKKAPLIMPKDTDKRLIY
jgi:hypothetical protein